MKINPKKDSFLNKYKIVILITGLTLSAPLTLFVLPLIMLQNLHNTVTSWNYIAVASLCIIFICILGFSLVNSYSNLFKEIKKQSKEVEYKNFALTHMFNELKASKEKLDIFSESLERKVFEKTESIQNLLDNAKQGFLTFGADLVVDEGYSLECKRIFNRQINGENISKLIFPGNLEQQELIQSVTSMVLMEQEQAKRATYLSLLPQEATINNKQIQMDYKIITISSRDQTEAVMLILTDITETRILQAQMDEEKNVLKMVVNIVTNYSDFMDCVKDYDNFCKSGMFDIINTSYSIQDIIIKLYRSIHTFKGSFSQFGLKNIPANLHQFEFELSELLNDSNNMSLEDLDIFLSIYNLREWLNEDLFMLKSVLGASFFQDNEVVKIDKQKLLDIENKMLSFISPLDYSLLIPDIRKFRYKQFRELLKSYTNYVLQLSDRFIKQVNPLVIEGGDFFIDPGKYSSFTKSLGHVFRDIMEYGIEPWDERVKSGKSEFGNIKCSVELVDNLIKLSITDDGFGIDIDLIKKTAVEKGYFTKQEINDKNDHEIVSLIFYDGFSTNCEISELSGRGMGLSAVKDEVDKLGGTIEVNTSTGMGTKFTFLIPYASSTDLPIISEIDFMNALIDTTKNFFDGQVSLSNDGIVESVKKVKNLALREVSVIIAIKGAINGIFFFTADKNLLKSILSYFVLDPINPEEDQISNEDVLAECTNMIMGNFSKSIPHIEDYITLGTPVTLHSQEAKIEHSSAGIWNASLESDKGNIEINFINSLK